MWVVRERKNEDIHYAQANHYDNWRFDDESEASAVPIPPEENFCFYHTFRTGNALVIT